MTYEQDTALVKLPSDGLSGSGSKLINGHTVRVRALVLGDRREIAAAGKTDDTYSVYKKMWDLLVVEPKNLDADKLLISDVAYAIFMSKIVTYGYASDEPVFCDKCDAVTPGIAHLEKMEVVHASDIKGYSSTGIDIELPSGRRITAHLPTLDDERKVQQMLRDMDKDGTARDKVMDKAYARRAVLIDAVNEEPVINIRNTFDEMMKWRDDDYYAFRDQINEKQSGLQNESIPATCSVCKTETEASVTLTPSFFRSSVLAPEPVRRAGESCVLPRNLSGLDGADDAAQV